MTHLDFFLPNYHNMWKLPWQACSHTHYSLMSIAQNNHWFSVSFTILVYAEFYADTHGVLIELHSVDFFEILESELDIEKFHLVGHAALFCLA